MITRRRGHSLGVVGKDNIIWYNTDGIWSQAYAFAVAHRRAHITHTHAHTHTPCVHSGSPFI